MCLRVGDATPFNLRFIKYGSLCPLLFLPLVPISSPSLCHRLRSRSMSEETSSSLPDLEDDNAAVGIRNPQEAENSAAESKPANAEKVPRRIFLLRRRVYSAAEVREPSSSKVREPSSSKVNAVDERPAPRKKSMKHPPRPKPRRLVPPPRYGDGLTTLQGLGIENPTWILDKSLSESDVSGGQSRLLLTGKKVIQTSLLKMMSQREIELVNDKKEGLPVMVIDESYRKFEMMFKYLDCNGSYRLIGQWGSFVKEKNLRAGDKIQIWAFRRRRRINDEEVDELGLALLDSPTVNEQHSAEAMLLLKTKP
ncbi:uncharacterized protein [Typha latifolia]|uniref:uncharacterized protein n=1 Tax=Typha latifolia TaxID=4733 RepID=UPI003C2EE924